MIRVSIALLIPATAWASWWNDEWKGRKQFAIDTGAAGITEPIGPAAVLLRLHPGNFKLESLKEDGSDLRVISGDDKTPLKYHLEKFDPLLGEALLWIGFSDLKPGSRTNFWLYFSNPKAAAGDDAKGTYDASTVLVYHFAERGQPPRDSSNWGNHAAFAAPSTDGASIGRGLKLEGDAAVTIPGGPSLAWASGGRMTWSVWLKPAEAESSAVIFSRSEAAASLLIGLEGGKPFVEASGPSGSKRGSANAPLAAQSWHHLAVVAADAISVYVDGVRAAEVAMPLPALTGNGFLGGAAAKPPEPIAAPPAKQPVRKGAQPDPAAAPMPFFKGELDELQVSKIDRGAGFIRLAAIGQGPNSDKLIVPGQEDQSGGFGSGYFSIILQSVTPDGWVVIALLAVMAVISWVVMASKASYLSRVERADRQFTENFRQAGSQLAKFIEQNRRPPTQATAADNSPLRRVFEVGAAEVRSRTDGTRPLHADAIEAIRASMEAVALRETQRLNKSMVLLTIAISGGPFLGLLGTVVGVMITFAAIAAAGDVNVNAIAPGIAAALVATVAGLGVAIPALFGYNWLLTRIKNASTNMKVFADELVAKVAEAYSERAIAEPQGPAAPPLSSGMDGRLQPSHATTRE